MKPSKLAAIVAALTLSSNIHAVSVTQTGANGLPGANGTLASPNGTDGGDGQSMSATANGAENTNNATVRAGHGGTGGNASNGGTAGDGGTGGTATATAITSVSSGTLAADAQAYAYGGNGGVGGGLLGAMGTFGNGGDGGAATASGTAYNSAPAGNFPIGSAFVTLEARGGHGGAASIGGTGGNGGQTYLGTALGESTNGADVRVTGRVFGGNGGSATGSGGVSGDGASVSLNNAVDGLTTGRLTLIQEATGGNAGNVLDGATRGSEGNAFSSLSKTTSSTHLSVETRAVGGQSSAFSTPGQATAISEAINYTGSATASTRAWGGISNSSATAITYGNGHTASSIGRAEIGATATSISTATAHGNSIVTASDFAKSTQGNASSTAIGSNAGSQSVTVTSAAQAGAGSSDATATASGSSSGGGTVRVTATQTAGQADAGIAAGNSIMTNAVSGSTSGWLVLEQTSKGGDGYGLGTTVSGDAVSSLTATNLGGGHINGTTTAEGMNATASIILTGDQSVTAKAIAKTRSPNAATGTAQLGTVMGSSTSGGDVGVTGQVWGNVYAAGGGADGASVAVSDAVDGSTSGNLTLVQDAWGGLAGDSLNGTVGRGGSATSTLAISKSVAALTVKTTATGGRGGNNWVSTGTAGNGGNTQAVTSAQNNAGTSTASAVATGGRNGTGYYGSANGNGGNATASANSSGIGITLASARATGGNGATQGTAHADATTSAITGTALAEAYANGSSSDATATAHTSGGIAVGVEARTSATGINQIGARASVNFSTPLPTLYSATGQHSVALATVLPNDTDVQNKLDSHQDVAVNFDIGGTSDILAHALLGGAYSGNGVGDLRTYSSSLSFDLDMSMLSSQQNLLVGFLGSSLYGTSGLNALSFRVEQEGILVVNKSFTDFSLAADYFSGNTLNLGDWSQGLSGDNILDLDFFFDLTSEEIGARAGFELLVGNSTIGAAVVPIPATAWLFSSGFLGLLGLARKKDSA